MNYAVDWSYSAKRRTYRSFVDPNAICPVCGAGVFFYQSPNGGRVFFDALGRPWPKHPCTDNSESFSIDPKPWRGAARQGPPSFSVDGWQPIFEARWRPWRSSTYKPGVLKGLLGESRTPLSVTFPFGTALDSHAPLLGKAHATNPAWMWVDAPYFEAPLLANSADLRSIDLNALARFATELGHSDTLVKLADMCGFERDDLPGRADFSKARRWLEAAADLGDWRAFNNLGVLYECGLSVPADIDKALKHYRRAARSKQRIAVENLKRLKAGQRLRADNPNRHRHVAQAGRPTYGLETDD